MKRDWVAVIAVAVLGIVMLRQATAALCAGDDPAQACCPAETTPPCAHREGHMRVYRGDTHHHQVGEVSIEEQMRMLRERGDDFVFLEYKDRAKAEQIPDPAALSTPDFLVIAGAEQSFLGEKGIYNHLSIEPLRVPIPDTETDYWHIAEGFAHVNERVPNALLRINHPADDRWTAEDLREAVEGGARIWELNPAENGVQFAVDLWDKCLSTGWVLYASLSSDIHHLTQIDATGYVAVWAEDLEQGLILEAMRAGEFVAVQRGCAAEPLCVDRGDGRPGSRYEISLPCPAVVRFIGSGGALLAEVEGTSAAYEIKGNEGYVRAEVVDGQGLRAFTQPVFVRAGG